MPRTTPPKPKAKPPADGDAIAISVDGTVYTVRPADMTALDSQELRRQTGMSLRAVMVAAQDDPDLDVVASLVWLARRQAGERTLAFAEVAEAITYGTALDTAVPQEPKAGEA